MYALPVPSRLLKTRKELTDLLAEALADTGSLSKVVLSNAPRPTADAVTRVTIRPVLIRGRVLLQLTGYDRRKSTVKNHDLAEALTELDRALDAGFRSISVLRRDRTVQVELQSDGTARATISKPQTGHVNPSLAHDREKAGHITPENAAATLSALGFLTAEGEIKPTLQRKYRQVNEFVRILEESALLGGPESERLEIVDCGCGNAYLTFALFHYLAVIRSRAVGLTGIDRDPDAVSRNAEKAATLGFSGLRFVNQAIQNFAPETLPQAVLSLHACDTATDDAIARGIAWQSALIVCAPCCHHHLNRQLKSGRESAFSRALARQGLLLEKLGDVMTDAFRAQILTIMGYQVSTIKFVDPENTERNVLI